MSLARSPNTMKNAIRPEISSGALGTSGFWLPLCARWNMEDTPWGFRLLGNEERDGDTDQRERLGECEADPHVSGDPAGRLGLAGHGLDRVPEHQADADAGADGREAVDEFPQADERDRRVGRACGDVQQVVGQQRHVSVSFSPARRHCAPGLALRVVSALAAAHPIYKTRSAW